MTTDRYVVGIDGGGTKTHVLLSALDGEVLCDVRGGPSNITVMGIARAARMLIDLVKECCAKANATPETLQSVVMGLAGAGRAADRAELIDTIFSIGSREDFPLRNVTIETDAKIALEAAFAGGPGIVVIAGTGSIALYRTEDKQIVRAGGWGKILGDEGSAYAISRAALNRVMRVQDGRSERTDLTKKVLDYFHLGSVEELLQKIYYQDADITSFAPKVVEAVAEHDHIAYRIISDQANELVELVRVLAMRIPPKKRLPVALMGGLIEIDNPYSKLVRERIVGSLPQLVVQKPKFPTAYGAIILALNAFR